MSPNISGIPNIDIPKSIYLAEQALYVCKNILILGGHFLVKVFQGEGLDEYLQKIRCLFKIVKIYKPDASAARSREIYILAKAYKK